MNKSQPSDPTILYYERHAQSFANDTVGVDMESLYGEFVPLVRRGGTILDAGCGSGRDATYFQRHGFSVTAFDASAELAAIASSTLGKPVKVMTFREVSFIEEFDGVWACASLLHVPGSELDDVISRLARSLKTDGVMYASFKYGRGEGQRKGRFFNDFDEQKLQDLLERHPKLKAQKVWKTQDCRPERQAECWLNALVRKHEGRRQYA